MTHGCLLITAAGDKPNRKILLHTYHDGMDIPTLIRAAPAFYVMNRLEHMLDVVREWELKDIPMRLGQRAIPDGFDYPPTVASILIAVRPNMLEPVFPAFEKDLAKWAGHDAPHKLIVSDEEWLFIDEDGEESWSIDPYEMAYDQVRLIAKSGKEPDVSSAPNP